MATDPKFERAQAVSSSENLGFYPTSAYVVGNIGDPGLTTDYFCDIRSRFVLAVKEPRKRPLIVANSDGAKIFLQDNLIIVERPARLWIDCPKALNLSLIGKDMDLTSLNRIDQDKNTNVGKHSSFTQSDISPINRPYKIGEQITVQRLRKYSSPSDEMFQSFFPMTGLEPYMTPYLVPNALLQGQTMPNTIGSNGQVIGGGKDSTLFIAGNNYFFITMPKEDYENFIVGYFPSKSYNPAAFLPPNYEYFFGRKQFVTFRCASYLDMNMDNKSREGDGSCLPTIILSSDSFLTPQQRTTTSFLYTKI